MGVLSKKVIKNFQKLKLQKALNFTEFMQGKRKLEVGTNLKIDGIDGTHYVYSKVLELITELGGRLAVFKNTQAIFEDIEKVDELHMPSYPPQSPITGSYETSYFVCDYEIGIDKESMCNVFYEIGQVFSFDKLALKMTKNLSESMPRFYKHLGFKDGFIVLKDILTEQESFCKCTSGYDGEKNEIWYVRTVPYLDNKTKKVLSITTPYVILNSVEKDWVDFYIRQGLKEDRSNHEEIAKTVLKNMPIKNYWFEYIMDAYSNYNDGAIFLAGIPDIDGTRPHEMNNEF